MMQFVIDLFSGWFSVGALFVVPGLVFAATFNYVGLKNAGLLTGIAFALVLGWNARGILEQAHESAELRAALDRQQRAEQRANELVAQLESERNTIREDTDSAIRDIQRASEEASGTRGACYLTDAELDGLRRAFGFGESSTPSKSPD